VQIPGREAELFCIDIDLSERHKAEAELRIAATAFEAQEGIVVTDPRLVILRVNKAFTEIVGYTGAEAIGQPLALLLFSSGRHDADFYTGMNQCLQQDRKWAGEIWSRRKSGELFPQWINITAVMDKHEQVSHYVLTVTDITQRKAAEDQIRQLAFFDPLTDLPNRRLLMDRLQRALAVSERNGRSGAVLFIDLDHFKTLNDTLGHFKGDLLLQQAARRLSGCVREGDTVARIGGDEFVVMLEDLDGVREIAADEARTVGEKIVACLNQPYRLGDIDFHSTPSMGIALYSGQSMSMEELLRQADLAMYQAKSAGRNCMRFFDLAMQAVVNARAVLETDLHQGILREQFILHYQPQVHIANRALTITVNPAFSLLNNYLMQNIPIQTLCGGKAACGRCRFRVLAGASHLSPVRPAEKVRLGEALIAAGWRLSCQSHALRDITIELPGLEEKLDDLPQSAV